MKYIKFGDYVVIDFKEMREHEVRPIIEACIVQVSSEDINSDYIEDQKFYEDWSEVSNSIDYGPDHFAAIHLAYFASIAMEDKENGN